MFEKEVMMGSIKKQSDILKKLVEELEENPQFEKENRGYCHETLKRIESALRKIRRNDETSKLLRGFDLKIIH